MTARHGTWQRLAVGYVVRRPVWQRKKLAKTWRPTLRSSIKAIKRRMRRIERQDLRCRQRGVVYWQQREWTW